ncbi:MAG TPA: hypothetical protein VKB24_10435, partial [Candidatus Acidoferrum sp.]|nr:hypothetical protein [Candidatus Acidoferrum sp.]
RQRLGIAGLNEIYGKKVPGALWATRFFREGQAEEFTVVLRPDGALYSVHHGLPETAAGAALSKEEAIARASAYLANEKKMDLKNWKLVASGSEKHPNRVDHDLVWENSAPLGPAPSAAGSANPLEAFQRVQLSVRGDEVTNFQTFIKIPDEWRRQQERESLWRTLLSVFKACVTLAVGIAALVFFLREIRSDLMKQVPWRQFSRWSLLALAAFAVVTLAGSSIPGILGSNYNTSVPLKFMYVGLLIGFALTGLFLIGLIVALLGMGWFFLKQAYGEVELPAWVGMPREYYRDALLIAAGGTAAFVAIQRVKEWISPYWPTPQRGFAPAFGSDLDAYFPGLAVSARAVLLGLLETAVIAALAGFILAHCKPRWLRALLFLAASLAMVGDWGSPADFAKQWLVRLVFLAVVVFGVSVVARLNLLGYFLVLAVPSLLGGAESLLREPNGFYRRQGYIALLSLAVLLVWPLAAWLGGGRARQAENEQ